tara:strand:- start:187 stop:1371 length:1185 start_codon:yes stop_codon:yes gene_type:complete
MPTSILPPGIRLTAGIVGDGGNNEIATFTDTSNIQGESNLTFDGTDLTIATGSIQVRTIDYSDGTLSQTIASDGSVTFAQNVTVASGISRFGDGQIEADSDATNPGMIQIYDRPTTVTGGSGLEFKSSTYQSGYGWMVTNPDLSGTTPLIFASRANNAAWTEIIRLEHSGDLTLKGTTPSLTIGDTGDEDAMVIFDTDHDFYMGSGNTENAFTFGSGTSMGSNMIWQAGTSQFYFVGSGGVYVKDDINFYWGTSADYKMEYESSNARWVMWTNNSDGSGTNADIIRIDDGQTHIDALDDWVDDGFDIYDDAMLLASSHSPTAEAYDFGKGVFKKGREALIEAGVLKRYEDGWVGYNDQRMAALLAGGIYQTRWLVDEMKEKISELENKVKALGG